MFYLLELEFVDIHFVNGFDNLDLCHPETIKFLVSDNLVLILNNKSSIFFLKL